MDGYELTRLIITHYAVYLVVSVLLTVWVGHTLHKHGRIFLVDAFGGNGPLADAVNHLLLVGFYLINIGYVTLALRLGAKPVAVPDAMEILSTKIGMVLVVLGLMHFFNLFVFSRMRKRGLLRFEPPPVLPTEYLAPVPATKTA
jgi:hypothetical protein